VTLTVSFTEIESKLRRAKNPKSEVPNPNRACKLQPIEADQQPKNLEMLK